MSKTRFTKVNGNVHFISHEEASRDKSLVSNKRLKNFLPPGLIAADLCERHAEWERDFEIHFHILGRPISKKNNMQKVGRGSSFKMKPSKAYEKYEENVLSQTHLHPYCGMMLAVPMNCRALYFMDNRASFPDAHNLYQATGDLLEVMGIVANDIFLTRWWGSDIVGIDPDNPRTEITLTPVFKPIY